MPTVIFPSKEAFERQHSEDKPQLVYARVINDLDTPVSAYLKIAKGKPYAFLFESVQGGEIRGRYSFLGFSPAPRMLFGAPMAMRPKFRAMARHSRH